MKLFFIFLIFILSFSNIVFAGFGVSPSKLLIESEGSFYVINSDGDKVKFSVSSSQFDLSEKEFYLDANEKKKVGVISKGETGFVEVTSGEGMFASGVILPVEVKKQPVQSEPVYNYYEPEKENKGFIVVILINVIGLVFIGVLGWKKKLF